MDRRKTFFGILCNFFKLPVRKLELFNHYKIIIALAKFHLFNQSSHLLLKVLPLALESTVSRLCVSFFAGEL